MNRGVSIIFTIFILFLLFIFTATMLFIFQFWEKTSFKFFSSRQAYTFAKNGIEEGIWEINNDDKKYDCLNDKWRVNFQGKEVDLNEDGKFDSKWFYIKNKKGEIIGRYAVLVEDESGKVNINSSGNLSLNYNEGYGCHEISLFPEIIGEKNMINILHFKYGNDFFPGTRNFDDNKNQNSYETDGIDNDADGIIDEYGEGIDEPEEFNFEKPYGDDRPFFDISDIKLVDGIGQDVFNRFKNYITVFSYDLERNKNDEERININTADFNTLFSFFQSLGYSEKEACQISLNIIDYRDNDSIPTIKKLGNSLFIGIEDTPYLNEIDAVKEWENKTLESGAIILTEKGGQFVEIFNPYDKEIDIGGWEVKGVLTLFSNLWNGIFSTSEQVLDEVENGETEIVQPDFLGNLVPTTIKIREGAKIEPHSFYTIGDCITIVIIMVPPDFVPIILFLPTHDPSDCSQYEPIIAINPGSFGAISKILSSIPFLSKLGLDFTVSLYDKGGNLIEKTDYPLDTPWTTVQKNDPRMSGSGNWFPSISTPNTFNSVFMPFVGEEFNSVNWILNWGSSFAIKNNKFSSVGEISLIHKNAQWKTINLWKNISDRKIIDNIKVRKEEKVYGKININTSSEDALKCLPLVSKITAKIICAGRPYTDITEILGSPSGMNFEKVLLSRDITKYGFDGIDNDRDIYIDTEKEKEMVFSKIVGLITVRSNIFKITSIGEKVQDKNNNGKIEDEEIIATKKINAWYDRRKKKIIHRKEI
ncbi:MAG TPA: hypothetical protein P5150_00520 [Candidatus Ratteibacteria bacterium]|nr:hypothetical protein [Candidatus Ratteibacteria bacterium]